MLSSNGRVGLGRGGWGRSERSWGVTVVAGVLLALAGEAGDPRLNATLVGRLEPGTTGRLAVRWDGPPGAFLDAWVDLDGDGLLAPEELVADGRPLAPGIEVVSLDLAPDARAVPEPRVWVEARAGRPREAEGTAGTAASAESRDGCAWQPGFTNAGLDASVAAMAVFDDGTGPALYVGGSLFTTDAVVVNHIARWDGSAWSALSGPAGTGVSGDESASVRALAVYDDGSGPALYAGGRFTTAGGVTVNHIARWDGSAWSALTGPSGTGMSGNVFALAVFDDGSGSALYAGGSFTTAGGVSVDYVARWDGSAWCSLNDPAGGLWGIYPSVYALAVYDDGTGPALYVGGRVDWAGEWDAFGIARWDGSAWSALGSGVWCLDPDELQTVNALAVYDDGAGPALYAGGYFDIAGGQTVNAVARWDGTAWSALSGPSGTGVDDDVRALAVYNDGTGPALYAGGDFGYAGGVLVNAIARWDGNAWSALTGPSGAGVDSSVSALAVFDDGAGPVLYAGGGFSIADGVTSRYIARWQGSAWSALSGSSGAGLDCTVPVYDCPNVSALAVFDDGTGPALYAGGYFDTAGGATVNHVARWDGSAWSALGGPSGTGVGGGLQPNVYALVVFDDGAGPALYAGGRFTTAGGVTVNHIARWDGSAWSALSGPSGTGINGSVYALAVFDDGTGPALYAGGEFSRAGGVYVQYIARWDGSAWHALPHGLSQSVYALAVFDDGTGPALYAGGSFGSAGGVTVNYIARWDGSAWSPLSGPSGTGTYNVVYALTVYDDGTGPALYAGGDFSTAGGVTVNRIARWDGSAWSLLSGSSWTGVDGGVRALAVYNDGSGPALFAGGRFAVAGDVPVNYSAAWDGSAWSALSGPLDTGMNGYVYALTGYDDGTGPALFAGGRFTTAGGLASQHIAAWRCTYDTTQPSNPTTLASTTHTPGAWSSANVIGVEWSGAADSGGSGLAGYSVLFDTGPATLPDATVDVPQSADPHSTASGVVADGRRHWFHLRTCDHAGNCSAGVHLGPFWVDATPPSGPSGLTSTSHTPGVPSSDRTVDLVWNSPIDAGSGLDGYAFAVNGAAAWTCDHVKDLERDANSLTTSELADNAWYVHLCATDNAGNWGTVVTAGPYLIGPLFADGFELGNTTAWSHVVP